MLRCRYKDSYGRLKGLKAEIEHLQLMLEKSRKRLQKDFEGWYEATLRQAIAREKAAAVRNGGQVERVAVSQQARPPPPAFALPCTVWPWG